MLVNLLILLTIILRSTKQSSFESDGVLVCEITYLSADQEQPNDFSNNSLFLLYYYDYIMASTRIALFARTFASSFVKVVFWLKSLLLSFCKSTVEINTEACCMSRQSPHSQCCGLLSERRYREDQAARNSYRKVDKHTATDPQLVPLRPFVLPSFFLPQYPVKTDESDTDTGCWFKESCLTFVVCYSQIWVDIKIFLQKIPLYEYMKSDLSTCTNVTHLWPLRWTLALYPFICL